VNDDPSKNPLFSSKPDRLKQGSVDSFENLAPKTSEDAFLFREPLNKRKPPEGFESGSKKPGGLTAMLEEMNLFESNERLSDDAAERIFESSLDSFPNISGENSPSLNSLYAAASRAETNQTTQSRPMRFADQPFDPLPDLLASTDLVAPSLPVRSPSHGYEDDDNFPALSEFRGKQKASIYPYIAAISFFSVTTVGMLAYMLAGPQGAEPTRDGLGASASGVERNIDAGRQSGWEQEPPRTEKTNASAKDGAARAVNAEASKNRRKAVIALGAAAATQQQPALAQAAAIGPNPSSALLQSSIERMPESRAAAPEKEAVKAPSESMAANSAVTNKTEAPPAKIIAAPAALPFC